MIITRIQLENWKNFGNVDVRCGKRVFLIGPNASGKSNFLDALRFLRDVAQDGLGKAVESRGGMKALRFLGARRQPNITISVTLDHTWKYTLSFGTKGKAKEPVVCKETVAHRMAESQRRSSVSLLKRPDKEDGADPVRLTQTALEQVNANKKFRDIPEFFSSIQYRHILPQLVRDPKGFSPNPIVNDPFGRDLVFQIWKTSSRSRDARLRNINKVLQEAIPNLNNLSVEQDENGAPHLKINHEHWRQHGAYQNESVFSDGTLRLLTLLWTLLDQGGPLLLEEPELSLHEEIVRQLPSLFAKLDKTKKRAVRQVFITTHAEAMLRDTGIGADEVLRLMPGAMGTQVIESDEQDALLMQNGLSAAEVLLPKTTPGNMQQLSLLDL